MDDDAKRAIALFRLGVLGPLVSARLEHGDRTAYFVEAASLRHVMPPDGRVVRLSARTIEAWYYLHKHGGFMRPRAAASTASSIRAGSIADAPAPLAPPRAGATTCSPCDASRSIQLGSPAGGFGPHAAAAATIASLAQLADATSMRLPRRRIVSPRTARRPGSSTRQTRCCGCRSPRRETR